ncbi:MAG: thioredoxin family protein [Candidatus Hodarchaeota archaeon]
MTQIEVFIKEKEIATGKVYVGRPVREHWCTFKEGVKKEKVMSEDDKKTLEIVQKLAKENGLDIKVHNVSSFGGRLKARRRGVKNSPTIIIGKQKIEGVPTKEQILDLLQ